MVYVAVSDIPGIVEGLRKTFNSGKTLSVKWRLEQLHQLEKLLQENKEEIAAAVKGDLQKSFFLSELTEIDGPLKECKTAIANLHQWTKPVKKAVPAVAGPGKAYIIPEPYGVALLIAPWNYPVYLCIKPLVGAIAAGNCVAIKPSEVAPHCSAVLQKLIHKYLDTSAIQVLEGAVPETVALLKQQWDYIFYTGSTNVGKIVMRAAAENLTPVTLELGGKSPVVIDKSCNLKVTANRIAWGKFTNCGQTCVAPDYVLVHKDIESQFKQEMQRCISAFYGEDPQKSGDYSRIINQTHTKRLAGLLTGADVYCGGKVDEKDNYVAPTVLHNVTLKSKIMEDEIFGPILPVLSVDDVDQAIQIINSRPKPLALYVFAEDKQAAQKVLSRTSSGGACVNETVMHLACPELPFGGVGPSGMGAYNGHSTFKTFSHEKSVLDKPTWLDFGIRYPPYTDSKIKWVKRLGGGGGSNKLVLLAAVVVPLAIAAYYFTH